VRELVLLAPAARVWDALLVRLTDENQPIENMDRASWFLRLRPRDVAAGATADSLLDCGRDRMGTNLTYVGVAVIQTTVLLRPMGDSTAVRVNVAGQVVAGGVPSPCVSRGRLEAQILAGLRR
jgi:hypothetical protein